MSKREFLEVLRETLSEELSQNVVNGHIQYYDQYISGEINKGVSETEATDRLGDPRLIARTILETSGASGSAGQNGHGSQSSYSQSSYGQSSYSQDGMDQYCQRAFAGGVADRGSFDPAFFSAQEDVTAVGVR